jgi:glucosamine 6-phosphate synthetase-like amidotransferase/phosphosugar isomerase protein
MASDVLALRPVTDRFIFLEEGDLVELTPDEISIWNLDDEAVVRATIEVQQDHEEADRGLYRHHMLKEIHEQPNVISRTLEGRVGRRRLLESFRAAYRANTGPGSAVTIVACGSSYYTGAVARYWIEAWLVCRARWRSPANTAIAMWRYRRTACLSPFPVRGNGRYPGCPAPGQAGRLSGHADPVQCRHQLDGA